LPDEVLDIGEAPGGIDGSISVAREVAILPPRAIPFHGPEPFTTVVVVTHE
jgi:hypothetical protein